MAIGRIKDIITPAPASANSQSAEASSRLEEQVLIECYLTGDARHEYYGMPELLKARQEKCVAIEPKVYTLDYTTVMMLYSHAYNVGRRWHCECPAQLS